MLDGHRSLASQLHGLDFNKQIFGTDRMLVLRCCVAEAAGGLWYNGQTKKWEGASFHAEQKFVLKLSFTGARVRKGMIEEQVTDYKIMVTASGEHTGLPCTNSYPNETVAVADQYRSFSCTTVAHDYVFDLSTNRFLSIYRHGYVSGKDSNADTPVIEGGTCTKIDYDPSVNSP